MKRVAIWAAVSSLPQAKKISLDDQLATGRAHAQRHGAQIVAELVVPGESRDIVLYEDACRRIAAYAQLNTLITSKAIDVLIFLDRSRLGRTAALSMAVAELCNRASILLYETDSPPQSLEFKPADHSDMLLGAIKSVDAQQEVRRIQERHRKGMIGRVNAGKFPGRVNYGYREVYDADGNFVEYAIDQAKAAVVLLIISLYVDRGWGLLKIADHLNYSGEPAPNGGLWGERSLGYLLRRAWVYAGYADINTRSRTGRPYVRAPGNWEPIISEERVRAIFAEREVRNGNRRAVWATYRFSRMVYCAVCDQPMNSGTSRVLYTKQDGSQVEYTRIRYRCHGGHGGISEQKIYNAVRVQIIDLSDMSHRESLIAETQPQLTENLADEIAGYQARIAQLEAAVKRADNDYYLHGRLDSERYDSIVASAKAGILAAQVEITHLQDRLHAAGQIANRSQRVELVSEEGLQHLDDPDIKASNAWLRMYVRVWVEHNAVVGVEIL